MARCRIVYLTSSQITIKLRQKINKIIHFLSKNVINKEITYKIVYYLVKITYYGKIKKTRKSSLRIEHQ